MKSFAALVPALSLFGAVSATYHNETVVWTTTTVKHLTTYCPQATTLTYGTKTYTATAHETVTITDCDCTVTKPVSSTHIPHPPPASSHPPVVTTTKEPHVPITTDVPHIPVTTKPYANTTTLTTTKHLPPVSVTITVSQYTTYCPYPTEIPVGPGSTITVTEATSLTITACPCTLTKPGVVTSTTTQFTTYCPEPTTITIGTKTHTLPAGTVTIPVEHVTTVPAPEETHPAPPAETHPAPPAESNPAPPAETHPAPPAETHPAPPAETHPAPPAETHPAPPAETHPAPPAETHPAPPAETHPAPPAETHPVPPAETHPAPPAETHPVTDACVDKCNTAYNACRTAPGANRSYCASQYASCLGYVPFNDEGSLVTPTACSSVAATEPVKTTVETQVVPTQPPQTQPITTAAPTFVGTGVSSYLPVSTASFIEANNAIKRDSGLGAAIVAGIVAAML